MATDMDEKLQPQTEALAARLEGRIDELVERMLARLLADPELARYDEPRFRELARGIARENLLHEIRALRFGAGLPNAVPAEAALAARQAVRVGAPVTVVLQSYRAGHAVLWEAWLDAVESSALGEGRRELLDLGSEFMFAYVERCTSFVVHEYDRYREAALRTRDQRVLELVRQLLGGAEDDAGELGYPLRAEHLGAVASGREAHSFLNAVLGELGGRALLVPGDDGTIWGWAAIERSTWRPKLAGLAVPDGVRVGWGSPAAGQPGFRQTHREAQYAHEVALRKDEKKAGYPEVALEAIALGAEERARNLVLRELRGLRDGSTRSERLRATLRAYFACGQNAAAAAAALGVNERTVRNRLQVAEEILGHPPVHRRAELEVALRFVDLLD
jgi:PucR C-terminal helix-turn-helix domain/GGDEF-like domain